MTDRWYARATLTGGVALTNQSYPVGGGWSSDEGWHVKFFAHAPTEEPPSFGGSVLRQQVDLEMDAPEARVQSLAWETLRIIADALAFAGGQRLEISMTSISNGLLTAESPATKTIFTLTSIKKPHRLVQVPMEFLSVLWDRIDDPTDDRGRRVVRAMRWLRRSNGALDEVEEFTVLAFGAESIANLLPVPDSDWLTKLRASQGKPRNDAADHSEILRYFAVQVCGVAAASWRTVGSPRHQLFHGGLTEDGETRNTLRRAIPLMRSVLIRAIKHTLSLSDDDPPSAMVLPSFPSDLQLTASGNIRLQPPSDELGREDVDTGNAKTLEDWE